MLHDSAQSIARLLHDYAGLPAPAYLEAAISQIGPVAMVSSFGADSAVLLHMLSRIDRKIPVLFIDTLALFPETLAYQRALAQHLGLANVQTITPDRAALFTHDAEALLHRANPEACCKLRKTEPLARALQGYAGWITGRKRHQAATRRLLERAELEPETGRIRLNPLADWSIQKLDAYFEEYNLPRHPLVARGYPSIGCQPCTSRVLSGEDTRAGRWRGTEKTECGIHFLGGVPQRNPQEDAA